MEKKKDVEGKWLDYDEIIDFLIEKVFILQERIKDLETPPKQR